MNKTVEISPLYEEILDSKGGVCRPSRERQGVSTANKGGHKVKICIRSKKTQTLGR